MRINKFITSNTEISRRKADQLILEGKVFLNDKKMEKPGVTINPETDTIKIENKIVRPNQQKEYFALNKPKGYITTRQDELMRKTIMDLIPKGKNLKSVGRLDKDSEGLLLISNDGDFINKLTHPKFECEKEYYVRIKKEITDKDIEKLEKGIKIQGKKTASAKIKTKKRTENETILTITIHEGRNRQVRKMFASLGYNVKYLQRVRIGKIRLGKLEKGKYRPLTNKEINVN